jgi:type IV pilus secretin PilQ/predicted competence protein
MFFEVRLKGDAFMKSIGVGKRHQHMLLVCASASLLFGCTTTLSGKGDSNMKESVITSDAIDAGQRANLESKYLYLDKEQDLAVMLMSRADFDNILIPSAGIGSNYEVETKENPNRLVVKFNNKSGTPLDKLDIAKSSKFLKTIELTKNGEAGKITVELDGSKDLLSDVRELGENIVLTVAKVDTLVEATDEEITQRIALLKNSSATDSAEPVIIAELDNLEEKEIAEVLATTEDKITDLRVLNSLELKETTEGSATINAKMDGDATFKVEKTAPSEYVVTLFGTKPSDSLRPMILAKNQDCLIRSVRSVQEGENTLLRVFAKPQSSLEAKPDGKGSIVVDAKAIQTESVQALSESEDLRAQFKPEDSNVAKDKPKEEKQLPPGVTFSANDNAPKASAPAISGDEEEEEFAEFLGASPRYTGRLISLDLQETDIDNALRIIAEVSNLNIIASDSVTGKVTLRLIDVPWDQALDVILKTNGLDKVQEGNVVRIAPVEQLKTERMALKDAQQAERDLESLKVRFIRVSYARASELKPLIDSVVSERGMVSFDERTNQIIVKDIQEGLKNVKDLIEKLDLRTPQVLLETQIVEANRTLLRDIGSEFGFSYVQSPQTGNATGSNFPNSVQFGGSFSNPAASTTNAISLLLGSADGSKSLSQVVTALENEGTVRVVSRPAVATLNNTPATIRSIEKVRIRLPAGGVSVATGQGAQAQGQGTAATEIIQVGIVLEVTPQASPDYYVLLDINAKSSTLGTNNVDDIPSEIERSAQSSVLVSSGQTFALGGIYKISDKSDLNGLPFFKDIPVVGSMFRRASSDNRDEELLFFVTPRIVEGSFDDAAMTPST